MEGKLFPLPVLVRHFSFRTDAKGTQSTKYKVFVYHSLAVSETSKTS